jgi:acyl-CoA thioesterase FadM
MLNDKNEVCAELVVVFGLFDLKTRKLIAPSDDWKKAIGL